MDLAKKKRQKRKRKNRALLITKVIFSLVFIWFLGNSLINFAVSLLVDTEIVHLQTIEKKYQTKGYLIRDELIINAPATGTIRNPISPGEKVAKDAVLFEVITTGGTALQAGEPIQVKAPVSGVVSYITDGLEEFFQPNELQTLDMRKIEKLEAEVVDNSKSDVVVKGERFCKIVNNLQGIQIYMEFPLDIFKKPLRKNQKLTLRFSELDKEISVAVIDLKGINNTAQVLVKMPETWYSLINVREVPIQIILDKQEGVLVPKTALIGNDQKETGIYSLREGFVFWQSVNIIEEKENKVLIKGLEPLTEIILNPRLVKEGQYLY